MKVTGRVEGNGCFVGYQPGIVVVQVPTPDGKAVHLRLDPPDAPRPRGWDYEEWRTCGRVGGCWNGEVEFGN